MSENDWFVMRPQKAQAYGRAEADGFLVRKGSTAMREGSPRVKRDREERDRLVRQGVLVLDSDPGLSKQFRGVFWRRSLDALLPKSDDFLFAVLASLYNVRFCRVAWCALRRVALHLCFANWFCHKNPLKW